MNWVIAARTSSFPILILFLNGSTGCHPVPPVPQEGKAASTNVKLEPVTFDRANRSSWRVWADLDGDCQDTRNEVLLRDSQVEVRYKTPAQCVVAWGRWTCPYTGKTVTDLKQLSMALAVPMEYVVPIHSTTWTDRQFIEYQNYLDDPSHIRLVTKESLKHRLESGFGWIPKNVSYHCDYDMSLVLAFRRFGLNVSGELIGTGMLICPGNSST